VFDKCYVSEEGFERTWAVNHLAPFLLTTSLLDVLQASTPARIITTASALHQRADSAFVDRVSDRSYKALSRYSETKLANVLFTVELARRLGPQAVTANCFHPGLVQSAIVKSKGLHAFLARVAFSAFGVSAEKGAQTLLFLAAKDEVGAEQGGYFIDCRRVAPSIDAHNLALAGRLWQRSAEEVAPWTRSDIR